MTRILNLNLVPVISTPHFLLGCLLAASYWRKFGYPQKARNVIKWGFIGTVGLIIAALYLPTETLKLMWPVGIGINIGTGMALRTLLAPAYQEYLEKANEV